MEEGRRGGLLLAAAPVISAGQVFYLPYSSRAHAALASGAISSLSRTARLGAKHCYLRTGLLPTQELQSFFLQGKCSQQMFPIYLLRYQG